MRLTAAGFLLVISISAVQPASDPARVLSDMRQALGGDAAIAAVQSFSANGSESRNTSGHTSGVDVEWICQLPDRFMRVRRLPTLGGETVELHQMRFEGFKTENGLTWPHRFVESVGNQVWTTTKIGKFRISPKIDPKKFDVK